MKRNVRTLLDEVASEITPSKKEEAESKKAAKDMLKRINAALKGLDAKARIHGSFKKQTHLKNSYEKDIFVHFNYKKYSSSKQSLSSLLEKKLRKTFKKLYILHGSRVYFKIKEGRHSFEIVPILDIRSSRQAKNITDVSPLHAKWVREKSKKLKGEIRLTKKFLKAQNIYGAESHVKGFSGYSCEILTIHYGSFLKLLQASKKWAPKQIIDPERTYKNSNPLPHLNKSKTTGPLVLIDPVQSSRNVTAALSRKSYDVFVKAAKKFLEKPSRKFFSVKSMSKEDVKKAKKKKAALLLIEIKPKPGKPDVIGASTLKKYEFLKSQFEENGFKLEKSSWFREEGKNGVLWFLIRKPHPPKYEVRAGPRTKDKTHSKRFKAKHGRTVVRKGRLYARVRRRFATPKDLVNHFLDQKSFKQKTNQIKAEWH